MDTRKARDKHSGILSVHAGRLAILTCFDVHGGMVAVAPNYTRNDIGRTYRQIPSSTAPEAAAIYMSFAAAPRSTVLMVCYLPEAVLHRRFCDGLAA